MMICWVVGWFVGSLIWFVVVLVAGSQKIMEVFLMIVSLKQEDGLRRKLYAKVMSSPPVVRRLVPSNAVILPPGTRYENFYFEFSPRQS